MKKIIYFTAGNAPTSTELAEIAVLQTMTQPGYQIAIRNGANSAGYGYGIEQCDLVAGTVPTSHNAKPVYSPIDSDRPTGFNLSPQTVSLAALATKQLYPIAIKGANTSALIGDLLLADVTYVSSAPSKATVSAGGLITGVAAGTTTITATYTFESGKTVTATCAVTVTA